MSAAANLANAAIAAHRQGAGLARRGRDPGLASASLVACAAELAAVNRFAGNPEAPQAFVTGGEAEPHQAADSTTTSTTSSTTTDDLDDGGAVRRSEAKPSRAAVEAPE